MNKVRVAAAATALCLIAAFGTMGSATAATSGVGTTETQTSLLRVSLGTNGSILGLRVLGDDAKSTIDPSVGPTEALSQLFAVKLGSSLIPALNLTLPNPPFESKSPGGTSPVTGPVLNLGSLLPSLPLVGSVLGGTLSPVNLTSSVTEGVASSGLTANLANLNVVGGLLTVDAVNSTLGALAGPSSAAGERSIKVGTTTVLDLGALLAGLGIDLTDLSVANVTGILDMLNVLVPGVAPGESLSDTVADLIGLATGLANQALDTVVSALPAELGLAQGGLLGGLVGGVPVLGTIVSNPDITTVETLLDGVLETLNGVLGTALTLLDDLSLLKVNGLEVGTVTKAVDGVDGSISEVIGKIGEVSIGNLTLPGVDLGSALSTVTGLVNTVQGTLSGVLGSISPDLANLLQVKVFDTPSSNGVSTADGYTRSLAGITGLAVNILPPGNLTAIVDQLAGSAGIGSFITDTLGGELPVLGSSMLNLNSLLGGTTGLASLAGGASIKVADVATGSNFAVAGAGAPGSGSPVPVSQLPRTGMENGAFLALGLLFAAAGFGARRWLPALRATR